MSGTQNHVTREWESGRTSVHWRVGSQHTLAVSTVSGYDKCLTSVYGVLGFVVDAGVGFGGVISKIGGTRTPCSSGIGLGICGSGATRGACPWISFFGR